MGRVRVVGETEKAIRIVLNDFGNKMLWLPKKLIHLDSEVMAIGEEGRLVVSNVTWWRQGSIVSDQQNIDRVIRARAAASVSR